jgi:AraC family transcriptional regulator
MRTRERLFESPCGSVEDLRLHGPSDDSAHAGYSPHFQVCLPYRGLFVWRVGHDEVIGDTNQVVFVRADEDSRVRGPLDEGYGELILTPAHELLAELAHASGTSLATHPLFRRRTRRADAHMQILRSRFIHLCRVAGSTELERDEAMLKVLRHAVRAGESASAPPPAASARLVRRAKEFLQANLAHPIRLAEVARAAGASPAYLTDLFRRTEGVSLHRYLVHLRLSCALVALPKAGDLTALALAVGFSSHSHFTAAFRRAYGTTPSEFRRDAHR